MEYTMTSNVPPSGTKAGAVPRPKGSGRGAAMAPNAFRDPRRSRS